MKVAKLELTQGQLNLFKIFSLTIACVAAGLVTQDLYQGLYRPSATQATSPMRIYVSFVCFSFLSVSLLSIGSFHCAPDENDRPSEQTKLCFAFVNLCSFSIFFLVSSLKCVREIIVIYLTFKR